METVACKYGLENVGKLVAIEYQSTTNSHDKLNKKPQNVHNTYLDVALGVLALHGLILRVFEENVHIEECVRDHAHSDDLAEQTEREQNRACRVVVGVYKQIKRERYMQG